MNEWDSTGSTGSSAEHVTPEGAAWLASASAFPRSVRALWAARPWAPTLLPCGTAFDAVSLPALFGRRVLGRLWAAGPACGPVAVHWGRLLLFCAPGTAARLPPLLDWEEWRHRVPRPLCLGPGDAVMIPPPHGAPPPPVRTRWLVAPTTRHPWLPGPDVLLRACVHATGPGGCAPGRPSYIDF